ncbi:MAG: archease [Arhodomonas sp.]|nr:archease [Arhodomonas sp.]
MATRHWLFARFAVETDGHHLSARAWGEPVDNTCHQPATEVKGATYTGLAVRQLEDGRWLAQCVVDV